RVLSAAFPNTLKGVVNQSYKNQYQFEVVKNNSINQINRNTSLYNETKALAKAVFNGVAPAIAVNTKGQGHLNFGNVATIQGRSSSGPGVTASQSTKAGFSKLGSAEDTLHITDAKNPKSISHTSGFMHGRTTGAPDFTTGYNVSKPDFTAAANMGRDRKSTRLNS